MSIRTRLTDYSFRKRLRSSNSNDNAKKSKVTRRDEPLKNVFLIQNNNNSKRCTTKAIADDIDDGRRKCSEWRTCASNVLSALELSHDPSVLKCRENELSQIRQFISTCVEDEQGDSLYICGSPGTGKSLSVNVAMNWGKIKNYDGVRVSQTYAYDNEKVQLIGLNAMQLDHRFLYNTLLCAIGGRMRQRTSEQQAAKDLKKIIFKKKSTMILLMIDEIDGFLSKAQAAQTKLYQLFEWPKKKASKLILIGVANAMDLTHRFLPRLRARECEPTLLIYSAYKAEQLSIIMKQRLQNDEKTNELLFFDEDAIDWCAKKVASRSGDIRKCLDFCRQTLVENVLDGQLNSIDDDEYICMPRINITSMPKQASKLSGSPFVKIIRNLPRQQKIMLCVAAIVFHKGEKDALLKQFHDSYRHLAEKMILPGVSSVDFTDIFTALNEAGLVTLKKTRGSDLLDYRVVLNVQYDDLEYAMESSPNNVDREFFKNVLKRGELRKFESCKV